MIPFSKLAEYVSAEPFRPFRIQMASGQSFEIRHPEMILLGRTTFRVCMPPISEPDKPSSWHDASLMLTESVAPMDAASKSAIPKWCKSDVRR